MPLAENDIVAPQKWPGPLAQPALPCHGPYSPPAGGRLCTAPKKAASLWLAAFLFPVTGKLRPHPCYLTLPGAFAGLCAAFLPCVGWGEKRFSCGFLLLFDAPAIKCRCPSRAPLFAGVRKRIYTIGGQPATLAFLWRKKIVLKNRLHRRTAANKFSRPRCYLLPGAVHPCQTGTPHVGHTLFHP